MVKFMILGMLFLLCCGCDREEKELPGKELCRLIERNEWSGEGVDSLVRLSAELSDVERYVVLQWALCCPTVRMDDGQRSRYVQKLDSLKFPEVKDKAMALMMLESYFGVPNSQVQPDFNNYSPLDFAPWAYEPEWIASLLFDLEHRWRLTPQEYIRFLLRKAELYRVVFKEYKSSQLIIEDGLRFACKYGMDSTLMSAYYGGWNRGFIYQDSGERAVLNEQFIKLADTLGFDSVMIKRIYQFTGYFYMKQGNYSKAYEWLSRVGLHSLTYNIVVPMYLGLDSVPEALAFLEEKLETTHQPLFRAGMLWYEALARQQMGDRVGYERCLRESLELFDPYPLIYEVDRCAVSEAYARLLWERGQRAEAIRRMEFATKKLLLLRGQKRTPLDLELSDEKVLSGWLNRFRVLRNFYNEVGRTEDALRQSLLCDSLDAEMTAKRLQWEEKRVAMTAYSGELTRNLELKAAEFEREQMRLRFSYVLLGLTLLGLVELWVLYRRRQRQLNVLYARQKEVEWLEAEKRQMAAVRVGTFSPEEELFRELERRFYEEELFRNPGFSRDDLCRFGGSNRMYVSTCINKYAGTNINQWINKARIDYAIRLIGEGEDDLTNLSELSGFASIKSFFRSFKQFTEITPRQYIIRERQNATTHQGDSSCDSEKDATLKNVQHSKQTK